MKRHLTETDVCMKFITPALQSKNHLPPSIVLPPK